MKNNEKPSFKDLITSDTPLFVDFFAEWCGPCKAMTPLVNDLAVEFSGRVKTIKIDIDKNQSLAALYKIKGVPTFMIFQKGKIRWQQSGMMNKMQLSQILSEIVEKS